MTSIFVSVTQLATPVWGEALARRIRESCMTLERLGNLDPFAGGSDLRGEARRGQRRCEVERQK